MPTRIFNPAATWGPYDEGRHVSILCPQPLMRYTMRVLGEQCVVLLAHFLDDIPPRGRYVACHSDPAACVGCRRHLRPRSLPFLACWWDEPARHVILQLTRDCLRENQALQPFHGEILRGRHITVWREGKTTYSPLRAALSEPDPAGQGWPIAADVIAMLARLYQRDQAALVLVDEAA